MPKLGMKPIRRAALVDTTIAEIGQAGSLDVTVSQIARRAGMSSALALANGPLERLKAIIHASFEAGNFRRKVISAGLNFYVQAHNIESARRLLKVYQRQQQSNLMRELRPLIGPKAEAAAGSLAALINGLNIRHALGAGALSGQGASAQVLGCLAILSKEPGA